MRIAAAVTALALVLLSPSCSRKEEAREDATMYDIRGVVVQTDPARRRIVLDHEEIPDFMMAMTMPFAVKDTTLLSRVQPGDTIVGTLAVTEEKSWLENLFVVGRGSVEGSDSGAVAYRGRRLAVGDRFPDLSFLNQDGRRLRMSEFDGRAVALTFVYTRCPLPDFCIQMTTAFAEAQKALSEIRSLEGRWHLLTVSFDPSYDTPSVLRSYGRAYGADFRTWDFVTENPAAILEIAGAFGLVYQDQGKGNIIHNLRTVVIGRDRRVAGILEGNEWKPEDLVALMEQEAEEKSQRRDE